ncbi:hypothetical protein TNCV_387501 [Trichonephila clavipes]|nr:hypothetical protein TNCV_387501 [Trichonephila clavipes]
MGCRDMPIPVTWPAALDYVGENPWREEPDQDGSVDSRLGLSQVSLLARRERLTHPGALRATNVDCQDISHCPDSRLKFLLFIQ